MEGTPRLYDTLVQVLSQHQNWVDLRHLKTLAWMIVGLIQAGRSSLTAWSQGFDPLKASHDTWACQFTNGPVGLCFHAHTCSV